LSRHVIIGTGEILWDVFPDGPRFGGAPSNFACSVAELAGTSAEVSIVSAVGDDDLGRRAISELEGHGVDTSCVQIDRRETGQVLVDVDSKGVASYRFADDSAWDHLVWTESIERLASRADAVCFGTLGQRSAPSRETIRRLVETAPENAFRILDVNLRSPFFDDSLIRHSLFVVQRGEAERR